MKKYVALFLGPVEAMEAWKAQEESVRKEKERAGMEAWGAWMEKYKDAIVDGTPLGKTKRIDKSGISDIRNEVGAYTIVQAESHEAAAAMFADHPHFTIFPGERVEVMECIPIPTR